MDTDVEALKEVLATQAKNVDNLVLAVINIAGTVEQFAGALDRRPTKRQFYGLGVILAVFAVVILGIGLVNRTGVERIQDCTTAGGKCYQEQQARSAEFIVSLSTSLKCQNVTLINELADVNHIAPIPVPQECGGR